MNKIYPRIFEPPPVHPSRIVGNAVWIKEKPSNDINEEAVRHESTHKFMLDGMGQLTSYVNARYDNKKGACTVGPKPKTNFCENYITTAISEAVAAAGPQACRSIAGLQESPTEGGYDIYSADKKLVKHDCDLAAYYLYCLKSGKQYPYTAKIKQETRLESEFLNQAVQQSARDIYLSLPLTGCENAIKEIGEAGVLKEQELKAIAQNNQLFPQRPPKFDISAVEGLHLTPEQEKLLNKFFVYQAEAINTR